MATSTTHCEGQEVNEDVLLTAASIRHGRVQEVHEEGCFTDGNIYHTWWGARGHCKLSAESECAIQTHH